MSSILELFIFSVDCIKLQLDTENLGIVTKIAFLNEFFPESEQKDTPVEFKIYHYNGLARSNQENEVLFNFLLILFVC